MIRDGPRPANCRPNQREKQERKMKERNEYGLTRSQRMRLFKILLELQDALESVRKANGTTADVERWKKPLFERASAILRENLTHYHQTMGVLRRHGIVDELQEEADREEEAYRLRRIERAERLNLLHDSRASTYWDQFGSEYKWLNKFGSDY